MSLLLSGGIFVRSMLSVRLTSRAHKSLDVLQSSAQKRIVKAIDELEAQGRASSNLKSLQPPLVGYRKRVGDYRILFEIVGEEIMIYAIDKCSDVYRK